MNISDYNELIRCLKNAEIHFKSGEDIYIPYSKVAYTVPEGVNIITNIDNLIKSLPVENKEITHSFKLTINEGNESCH